MAYNKQRNMADCPRCGYLQETTAHILQCPNLEAQRLWDSVILQLREQLLESDTEPGIIEDLSAGLDAWRKQANPPLAITNAGRAQTEITWDNFTHGFISHVWKSQQAEYYNSKGNPASPSRWAADLLRSILKLARQQWDHRNHVLHKSQPNRVKDLQLDKEIHQQYEKGRETVPQASKVLLNRPIELVLGLPHNEKQQWLLSIKAARQRQRLARARMAQAQRRLLAQFLVPRPHPPINNL